MILSLKSDSGILSSFILGLHGNIVAHHISELGYLDSILLSEIAKAELNVDGSDGTGNPHSYSPRGASKRKSLIPI